MMSLSWEVRSSIVKCRTDLEQMREICVFHHFPVDLHSSLLEILGVEPKLGSWRTLQIAATLGSVHWYPKCTWSSKSARSWSGWHGECPHHCLQQGPWLRINLIEQRRTADVSLSCRCWVASPALSNMFWQRLCRNDLCVNFAWKAVSKYAKNCENGSWLITWCVSGILFSLILSFAVHHWRARNERFCRLPVNLSIEGSSKWIFIAWVPDTPCYCKDLVSW